MGEFLNNLKAAIHDADTHGIMAGTTSSLLSGLSGESVVGLLQRLPGCLTNPANLCYLEVGVFRGLTLLSTAKANPSTQCLGIDNFSLFDDPQQNLPHILGAMKSLGIKNAGVINCDFEDALSDILHHTKGQRIGVYFMDGPHDYRSQLIALLKVRPALHDEAVIVVDDANYAHVRQANADFLACCPEYKLAFEAYTPCHPANMSPEEKTKAMAGWWNGINILVADPQDRLPRCFPPTGDMTNFQISHDVFRHEFAALAHDALTYSADLLSEGTAALSEKTKTFRSQLENHRRANPTRYTHQNTDSEGLPRYRMHLPDDG